MSKQTKKALVPALRFPAFRARGEWDKKPLGSICSSISSGKDKSDINGSYDLYGSTGVIGKTSSDTFTGNYILAARVGANAGLLTRASGNFGVTDNTLVIFLKKAEKIDFIYYSLDRFGLNKMVFGSGQPLITGKQLKDLGINFPDPEEQQKIADCLSSIDELITAHTQKHEALKTHKKGLMQQLFPATGETVPKLRFPEFRDAGEWKETPLGNICKYWNGASHEGAVTESGSYFLISLNSIDIEGNLKPNMKRLSHTDKLLQKNDLIMVLSDVAHGNFLGLTDIIPDDNFILNQRMAGLRLKDSSIGHIGFLRIYINNNQKYFKQNGQGSSQLNLSKSSVTDFPVLLPCQSEQQKIADCLSSLDELVTTQAKKIESLKAHKKGLMQKLFPAVDEAGAWAESVPTKI